MNLVIYEKIILLFFLHISLTTDLNLIKSSCKLNQIVPNEYSITQIDIFISLFNISNFLQKKVNIFKNYCSFKEPWKFIFHRYTLSLVKRERRSRKIKSFGWIVNSSLAFVSLASSILLETVSRWKLYGIRLCLPLSRTAFHHQEVGDGKGRGRIEFSRRISRSLPKATGNVQGSPTLPYEFAIPETRAESFL